MSWWRRKQTEVSNKTPLCFKSNRDAFDYACQYLNSKLAVGSSIPALVVGVVSDSEGMDELVVQIAGSPPPETIIVFCPTKLKVQKDDFIALRIMASRPFPPGPFCVPECILKPEYSFMHGGWIAERVLFPQKA